MTALFDFKNSESTLRWMAEPEGKEFLLHLAAWSEQKRKSLMGADDMLKIGRLQGALEVIDRILSLREEISNVVVSKR